MIHVAERSWRQRKVLVDLHQPALDCFERLAVGDVVDDHDTVGAAVVVAGDGLELLLPSSVPLA